MEKKLILAVLALLLVMSLGIWQEQNPDWVQYQKQYFAQQINTLQAKLKQTRDPEQKVQIEKEILKWKESVPEVVNLVLPNGQVERCKTCHIGLEEISVSHPSNTFGCTLCHGGNALSLDQQVAHANMYGQDHPGELKVSSLSCGSTSSDGESCHSGNKLEANNEVDLIKTSIMSTKAGELSSVRMMLGLDKTKDVPNLKKGDAAQQYPEPLAGRPQQEGFQANCLSYCHQSRGLLPKSLIGHDKISSSEAQDRSETSANGCEVCHVLSNPTHTYVGADPTVQGKTGYGMVHEVTTQIPYTQCNQCHNQGQHNALTTTFTYRPDLAKVVQDWNKQITTGPDRLADYYVPGEIYAQCEVSLDCIDCHTRQDVMGDNELWTSEYDAVHIQCLDCHGTLTKLPQTKVITSEDDPAFEEKITNPVFPDLKVGDQIIVTAKGEEMPFVRHESNNWFVYSRITGKDLKLPLVIGSGCKQNPEEQGADACHKCHTKLHS